MIQARGQILWWTAAATVLALLMVPLFVVQVPPLLDYPNHLARQWFLAHETGDPILSRFYVPHWAAVPDLLMDLVVVAALKVLPVYVAGKVAIAFSLISQLAGVSLYSRALTGRWSLWPLAWGLIAYNGIFLLGFLSFLASIGLALAVAAAWIAWREQYPVRTTLLVAAAGVFVFFCHALGFVFLGFLIASRELDRLIASRASGGTLAKQIAQRALALIVVALPCVVIYLAAVPPQATFIRFAPLLLSIESFGIVFDCYSRVFGGLVLGALLCFVYFAWKQDHAGVPRLTLIQITVLAILYLCCPFAFGDATWLNVRVAYLVAILLFAGVAPRLPQRAALSVSVVVALVLALRIELVADVWHSFGNELQDFREVIAPVTPGSKVLTVALLPEEDPAYWKAAPRARRIAGAVPSDTHLPALLMIERHAFWPMLFSRASQHTIRVRRKYVPLSTRGGELPSYQTLTNPKPTDYVFAPYLRGWQKKFDYVLLMNAGGIADLNKIAPRRLTLLTHADIAALYKVKPAGGDQLFDATTSTRSRGPPSVAPPTAVTSIKLEETPRSIK